MPLTPAHPAVVLPLRRLGLPLSALVAGAVAPDVPVYLPVGLSYATTHRAGGLAVDVVIGLVLLGLWFTLLRDPVVDLGDNWGSLPGYGWLQLGSTVVGGAVVGAYCVVQLRAHPVAARSPGVRRAGLWLFVVPVVVLLVGVASSDVWTAASAGLLAAVAVAVAWWLCTNRTPFE